MAGRLLSGVLRLSVSPPTGPGVNRIFITTAGRRDMEDGGAQHIGGTVTILTNPARRRVRLFERISGRLVRQTWSDPVTGAYDFPNIKSARLYMPVADDYEAVYNAVVADRVTPELP